MTIELLPDFVPPDPWQDNWNSVTEARDAAIQAKINEIITEGVGGAGATTLDELDDVTVAAYTAGFVLRADGTDFHAAQLASTDLSDTAGLVRTTGDQTIAGVKTFSASPVLPGDPTTSLQAATKAYVDAIAAGLSWQAPVLDCLLTDSGLTPTTGDRYLINGTGADGFAGHDNDIAQYDTDHWVFTDAVAGMAVIDTSDSKQWTYTGSAWVQFGAAAAYTASNGVKLVSLDMQLDLADTNPSLEVADGGVRVKVKANGGLERTADGLQIEAAKVTNAMLAGSIADSKLATISTADKVAWAAVNKTGSTLGSIADTDGLASPVQGSYLAWDTTAGAYKLFSPPSVLGSGYTLLEWTVLTASTTWTNMPAALTEFMGSTYYRNKFDLTGCTHFRLAAWLSTVGYTGADLNLQYSTDAVTWAAADTAAAGELAIDGSVGAKIGSWAELVAGAKADVYLRLVGKTGNAVIDPVFRALMVQFKQAVATGDASGPASSTDNAIARFDGTGGKTLQNSAVTVDDNGTVNVPASQGYNVNGSPHTHAAATLALSATDRLLGRATAGAGAGEEIACTAAGRAILDDADAATQRATLGVADDELPVSFGDGINYITVNSFVLVRLGHALTINRASVVADASGSIVLDVLKCAYADFPGSLASICASAKPTLSSAQKSEDATLTGWTLSLAKGDVLKITVNSVSGLKAVGLTLGGVRT